MYVLSLNVLNGAVLLYLVCSCMGQFDSIINCAPACGSSNDRNSRIDICYTCDYNPMSAIAESAFIVCV